MIDPKRYGVSFSIKQCRNFAIDPSQTLDWLIGEAGFGRFRLMSYWNEHEKEQGVFDFSALDTQVERIQQAGGHITLCLGARQPRWPENHWPDWAWKASKDDRSKALLNYLEVVVNRYKSYDCIVSYQLENEALLENFGERPEVDRQRLRQEFALVKQLDPQRPVIMTTSTSWGIPIRQPIPDIVGFSFYQVVYADGRYKVTPRALWIDPLRARLIRLIWHKPSFIHELQCEPWGPEAIWEMSLEEQDISMGPDHIVFNLRLAKATRLYPIDLWGGEWWYWRLKVHNDPIIWNTVAQNIQKL